ncbi:MAG: sigma-70 family RNA polymerase sigma factor [Phycisphaerales bacterium]|nr:sigma-70 family RNA polymerase sigma factor [Phycisphaerales bacterium]
MPSPDRPGGPAEKPGAGPRLSREEFAELFRGSYRALWCIAAGVLVDRAQADDTVQEAAIVAMRRLDDFDPRTNFITWCGQIVRYVALNERRRRRRERSTRERAGQERRGAGAAVQPVPAELRESVHAYAKELDEVPRTCLLLRTIAGMTYTQISTALGIPEGTAMSHVHRSRQHLRARLVESERGPGVAGPRATGHGATGGGA